MTPTANQTGSEKNLYVANNNFQRSGICLKFTNYSYLLTCVKCQSSQTKNFTSACYVQLVKVLSNTKLMTSSLL